MCELPDKHCLCLNVSKINRGILNSGRLKDVPDQYHKQIQKCVNCPDKHCLCLNVSKINRGILNSGRLKDVPNQSALQGEAVERIETYKYLGVVSGS